MMENHSANPDIRRSCMRRVLFVCTGNIFWSLTAEYALRHILRTGTDVTVGSAGTQDFPYVVSPLVRKYLLARGLDVSRHRRRTLTSKLLQEPGLVIAMSTEHRSFLAERFNHRDVPLFTEACGLPPKPLPDVDEAVADHETNPVAVEAHVRRIIDRIIELTPLLADRLVVQKSSQIAEAHPTSLYTKN
jgi:protein-tyrosine phosphatase